MQKIKRMRWKRLNLFTVMISKVNCTFHQLLTMGVDPNNLIQSISLFSASLKNNEIDPKSILAKFI